MLYGNFLYVVQTVILDTLLGLNILVDYSLRNLHEFVESKILELIVDEKNRAGSPQTFDECILKVPANGIKN